MTGVNGSDGVREGHNLPDGFYYGKIVAFAGTWGSGLGYLVMEDENAAQIVVPCDNAPTVRALDACFGDVIDDNHCVNNEAIEGKEIYWSYDEYGMTLAGFTPVDDWDQDWIEEQQRQQEGGEA
jgi:hypothetical protein